MTETPVIIQRLAPRSNILVGLRLRDIGFLLGILMIVVSQLLRYQSAPWTPILTANDGIQQLGISTTLTAGLSFCASIIMLIVSLSAFSANRDRIPQPLSWSVFACLALAALWIIVSAINDGMSDLVYKTGTPLVLVSVAMVFCGFDNHLIFIIYRLCPFGAAFFAALAGISFIQAYMTYGWTVFGSSSTFVYFIASFWLSSLVICRSILEGKRVCFVYILLGILLLEAVLLHSRSWAIQVFLLLLGYTFLSSSDPLLKRVFKVALLATILFVAYRVLVSQFDDFLIAFLDKLGSDTRSEQYRIVFSQITPRIWLLGGGLNATYRFGSVMTGSIDNQYLYLAYHWGIFTAISYVFPLLYAVLSGLRNIDDTEVRTSTFVLILWMCALGGLSVYNVLSINIPTIILPMIGGFVVNRIHINGQVIQQ